jgi:hypothetical protein
VIIDATIDTADQIYPVDVVVENSPGIVVGMDLRTIEPEAPASPKPKRKQRKKGRMASREHHLINKRKRAAKRIESLGGVNIAGVHCPTCTCKGKRLHRGAADRQRAYRLRRRVKKQQETIVADRQPPAPVEN